MQDHYPATGAQVGLIEEQLQDPPGILQFETPGYPIGFADGSSVTSLTDTLLVVRMDSGSRTG